MEGAAWRSADVDGHAAPKFEIPIMLVTPHREDQDRLGSLLEGTAWCLIPYASLNQAQSHYGKSPNPILMCDLEADGCGWPEMLHRLRAARRDACIIFLADPSSEVLRQELMDRGAFDVLTRPVDRDALLLTLLFAYSHCRAHWPKKSPRRAFQPVVCASIRLREKQT